MDVFIAHLSVLAVLSPNCLIPHVLICLPAGKIPLSFACVLTHHKAGLVFPVTHPRHDCFEELFTSNKNLLLPIHQHFLYIHVIQD